MPPVKIRLVVLWQNKVKVTRERFGFAGNSPVSHETPSSCVSEQATVTVYQLRSAVEARTPSVLRCLVLPRAICSSFFFSPHQFPQIPSKKILTNFASIGVLNELNLVSLAHWGIVLKFMHTEEQQFSCKQMIPRQTCLKGWISRWKAVLSFPCSSFCPPLKMRKWSE